MPRKLVTYMKKEEHMEHTKITCMAKRRAEGLLWTDTRENMKRQVYTRGLCQNFNWTRPDEAEKRAAILQDLFASCGSNVWIKPPLTLAMGNTVSIGKDTYINSNLTLVDDHEMLIGNGVLIAPNVTISATNHPLHYLARAHGEMYCKKVVMEDFVWIGSNVVINAGSCRRVVQILIVRQKNLC